MMQSIMDHRVEILGALLLVSEALSFIPALKSNGIMQLIISGLKQAVGPDASAKK